jgi:hypothetical protein
MFHRQWGERKKEEKRWGSQGRERNLFKEIVLKTFQMLGKVDLQVYETQKSPNWSKIKEAFSETHYIQIVKSHRKQKTLMQIRVTCNI